MNKSLITLCNSANQENEVDWLEYWKHQGVLILPSTYVPSDSPEQIIEKLPETIEEVLCRELDDRSEIIVKRRFRLGNAEKLTLEDIGNAFGGLSRERIRQLEEKALKKLQKICVQQEYAGKNYHVHPVIHFLLQMIHDIIIAEPNNLILEAKLFECLYQTFNIDIKKVKSALLLILPLMNMERIEFDYLGSIPVWGYMGSERSILEKEIKGLDDFLTRETPLPHTEFDVLVHLNKITKKSEKLTLAQLSKLVDLCCSIERREDDTVWGKFEYLKGRGNQVERLLYETGKPMSGADLTREVNHRLVPRGQRKVREQNLTNQIIGDERFVPIGRSGKWGLKSWSHIDTNTILTLMEECLITYNRPVSVDELFAYISQRRPVSKPSIIMYLTYGKETFVRTGRLTWGLAKWTDISDAQAWN